MTMPRTRKDAPSELRILVADDHAVVRAGLSSLIDTEEGMRMVGEAENGEEAVRLAAELAPDVIVLDLSMPGIGGAGAAEGIREAAPATRILVLTMHAEEDYLMPVLDAGGSGYVRKTSADEDLTRAIRTVARGEVFLYPAAAGLLLSRYKVRQNEKDPLEVLTDRERDVLTMTAEGYSSREIGEKLFISPKTVDTYRARVMEKLNLTHRAELVRFALETGLLTRG